MELYRPRRNCCATFIMILALAPVTHAIAVYETNFIIRITAKLAVTQKQRTKEVKDVVACIASRNQVFRIGQVSMAVHLTHASVCVHVNAVAVHVSFTFLHALHKTEHVAERLDHVI